MLRTVLLVKLDVFNVHVPLRLPVCQPQVAEACEERAGRLGIFVPEEAQPKIDDEDQSGHCWPMS